MSPEVIDRDAHQPGAPDKGQGKDEVTISKSELEGLRRERDEALQGNRDWAAHFRGRQPEEQTVVPEETIDLAEFADNDAPDGLPDDTPEKLVDDLAAKGVAGLKARGFVTAAEAQKIALEAGKRVARELIAQERGKMATDNTIFSEFPDLKDQKSELWAETAKRYQAAVRMDPQGKRTAAELYLAAAAAQENLAARKPARGRDDDDGDDDGERRGGREEEADRRRRADSQDARSRNRASVDEHDDMLSPEARAVIKGMGLTDAEYQASRRELGVTKGRRN